MFTKILTWAKANGASILGIVQTVLKAVKEILTGVINLLSIFAPARGAQLIVEKARNLVNKIDGWVEEIKSKLLSGLV